MTPDSPQPAWTTPATPPPYTGMAAAPTAVALGPATIYGPSTPSYTTVAYPQPYPPAPWAHDSQGPVYGALRPHQPRGFSIASMVIGICSLPLYSVPILAVVAVVFAFIAFRREPAGRGMAIAGLVTGAVVLLLWLLYLILLTVAWIVSPDVLGALGTAA